ncbi:Nitrilase family, member 2 [Seminavis robusta]|uniref:Nitrilase family, member 2 n=1 Tax=Seminavis robusta TaxID=568900 RepID=A0A9N8ERU4_9STRA|nr:Nitrilase family, member 2 [Seminavis robusta]|eukprot:Sro1604_g285370.1 Nitrilase family, member 2 (223) ;mRNA; f:13496-14164
MLNKVATILPSSFVPGENHIIIGRGRFVKQHVANRRFTKMITDIAVEYSAAPCKAEKGVILTKLINRIHDQSPDAGFVRKDPITGQWSLVEESLARQTAAQALRNHLSSEYRSSKQFKQKRRIEQIKEMEELKRTNSGNSIDNAMRVSALYGSPTRSTSTASSRCVSPDDDETNQIKDTLSLLMSAFGSGINKGDNPFEPRPLPPSMDLSNQLRFEPLRFAV